MQRKITRYISALLIVLLLIPALPVFSAANEEFEKDAPVDVVLLVDCSETLKWNDRDDLSLAAVRNFVDTVSLQDTRISVVAFGGLGDSGYVFPYGSKSTASGSDRVHEVVPMTQAASAEEKEQIKNRVLNTISKKDGDYTPLGHAMAAAVDILQKNGTPEGHGAVILVTDGVEDPPHIGGADAAEKALNNDMEMLEDAKLTAKDNKWQIYGVHLCYGNIAGRPMELKQATELMDSISEYNIGKIKRTECRSAQNVQIALQNIYADVRGIDIVPPVTVVVPGEHEFEVEEMTSEVTLNVFGRGVQKVSLKRMDSNESYEFTQTENTQTYRVLSDEDYFQVKLICPKKGRWTASIYGENNATVLVNAISITEMTMSLSAVSKKTSHSVGNEVLNKDDVVMVRGQLGYLGVLASDLDFYEKSAKDAEVQVQDASGYVRTFPVSADDNGFTCEIPVNQLSSGVQKLHIVLHNGIFRSGKKTSSECTFKVQNIVSDVTQKALQETANVNTTVRLDLNQIFTNPDNDPISYELTCVNDPNAAFTFDQEAAKNGYMDLYTGTKSGTFEIRIGAKDPDMMTPAVCVLTLEVKNQAPESKSIRKQEVWTDAMPWDKAPKTSIQLDLDRYFSDPDGLPLEYSVTVAEEGFVAVALEGRNILTLTARQAGSTTAVITASDGNDTVSEKVNLSAISGRAVFWRDNWIYFAIAAAILVLTIFVIVVLLKNKKVKGNWDIEFVENGELAFIEKWNIAQFTKHGKQTRFLLRDVLLELAEYVPDGTGKPWKERVSAYFAGSTASKIELVGVISKKGCHVKKVPKDPTVKVTVNGMKAQKLTSSGVLRIAIQKNDGSELVVNMKLK